ncbi:Sip1-related alpha-galactosidase [Paenibacillus sp. Soil750]|uniref:Sip1-related alpha-galactosidase n=1 Tax=Paenibacillus sp. Soil750 TaxID=1736398 RepID=UPI000AE9A5B9|nr:Sip1-related alpha-galactosidase [Paenibacillus sp. Soil750]
MKLVYQSTDQTKGVNKLGTFDEYTLHFYKDTEVSVIVKLRNYGEFLLGFVDGRIASENPFMRRKSFSGKGSIAITIDEIEGIHSLMANYQHNDWWTRPHFDPDLTKLPAQTVSLLWESDSTYYRLLPVSGPVFRTDLKGGGGAEGKGMSVMLSSYQGGLQRVEALAFVLGIGDDPYTLADRTTDAALKELDYPVLPRERKSYPEVLDYLGWCSWDAFYQKVDERGVLAKAEEFNDLGLPVRWMMIDDGWSTIKEGKLQGFDANIDKFPEGIAHTVAMLKDKYGVKWVGVWHTIVGYWGGIHPDSSLAKTLGHYLYRTADGSLVPYPDPAIGFGFWHAWHGYLQRQGINFVKVDSQAAINNFLQYERSVGASSAAAHQAIEASVALHFDNTMINCMGMAAENIWHRPKSAVSRNSDDFMPKSQNGFREHALQNAYNSYYHGSFYWGDWDMFWTINHDDQQNAVLRAISGGPVYISDALGQTNPSLLLPLLYNDGKLIRCARTALPTMDCLTKDPTRDAVPLKIWNYAGEAGIIAAFHIGEGGKTLACSLSASDIPSFTDKRVVLYEYFSQACRLLEPGESLSFMLEPDACKLFLLVEVKGKVTPLGLVNKYASPHAIMNQWSKEGSDTIRLREGGRFAFHMQGVPTRVLANGEEQQLISIGNDVFEIVCDGFQQEVVIEINWD